MSFFIFSVFSAFGWADDIPTQKAPRQCSKQVEECIDNFNQTHCDDFAQDEETAKNLTHCSQEEVNKSWATSAQDFFSGCSSGETDFVKDYYEKIKNLPAKTIEKYMAAAQIGAQARQFCEEKNRNLTFPRPNIKNLELAQQQLDNEKEDAILACTHVEFDRRRPPDFPISIPSWAQIGLALNKLNQMRLCFKAEAQGHAICPFVTGLLAPGVALKLVKIVGEGVGTTVRAIASGNKMISKEGLVVAAGRGTTTLDVDIANYLDRLNKLAGKASEKASIVHQADLVALLKNSQVFEVLKNMGLDTKQMVMGMLDSDAGKLEAIRKEALLTPSPKADHLIEVLDGKGSSAAAKALKEVFAEDGKVGKTLLPSHLSPERIRQVLMDHPKLQQYLHEIFGMGAAVTDFETAGSKITPDEFKARIKANFGHNGPNAGYTAKFTKEVQDELSKGSPDAQSFFRGTVFEEKPLVNAPKNSPVKITYPFSLSIEGVIHTVVDRLSLGTRVGITKLVDEVGGAKLAADPNIALGKINGLENLDNFLLTNPHDNIEQLMALNRHVKEMKFDVAQYEGASKVTDWAMERVRAETEFLGGYDPTDPLKRPRVEVRKNAAGQVDSIIIRREGPEGKMIETTLTADTPTSVAKNEINELLLTEERANGDPIREFGPQKKNRKASLIGGLEKCSHRQAAPNSGTTEKQIR